MIFSPLAYPGYDWMAQAVSDLSAANAPSLALWNRLSSLYSVCEVVCATLVVVGLQGRKTRLLRAGVSLFAAMEWLSAVGYRMFPLSDSGYAGAFQDKMHLMITALVVLIVGIVHTGVAYAMYFGSMKRLRAQTIALLSYIDPVFALLLSAAVLHEPITPLGLLGAALIIGSALVGEGRRQRVK